MSETPPERSVKHSEHMLGLADPTLEAGARSATPT
jgi:hypothetical protein